MLAVSIRSKVVSYGTDQLRPTNCNIALTELDYTSHMLLFKSVPNRGSRPRYSDSDIFWTMYMMSGAERVGRKILCDELDMGEGSARNLLSLLDSCDLINTFQTGSVLSERGQELFDSIPIHPVFIDIPEGIPGRYHSTVIVRDKGPEITNGMRERNAGIRSGGLGCTTLVFRDGHLYMPPDWNLDEKSPRYSEYLRSLDVMGPDDALIIGSADDAYTARTSAANAAFTLVG